MKQHGKTLIIGITLLLSCWFTAMAQQVVRIWHNTPVDADVTLTAYVPDQGCGVGVIVCPGGSYHWLDKHTEGEAVARVLNRHGIAAFVLEYRVAGKMAFVVHWSPRSYPMMMQDVQRSLQLVRAGAAEWHISPDRLGVMGFSAGGHLALMSAAFHDTDFLAPLGITTTVSLAPNFIAPIYPVVTMQPPYVHGRSRRGLMGDRRARQQVMRDSLSMERHAASIQCPVYLLNCVDDPIVEYHNSVLMDSALTAAGVTHRYVQLPSGGHGFGPGKDDSVWIDDFMQWLQAVGIKQ